MGPDGRGDHGPGESHAQKKATLRWRLDDRQPLTNLDARPLVFAGRCRSPDAATYRIGSQSSHRGRRRSGNRVKPRRLGVGFAGVVALRITAARANGSRATQLAR
jgi:hypothetical protein